MVRRCDAVGRSPSRDVLAPRKTKVEKRKASELSRDHWIDTVFPFFFKTLPKASSWHLEMDGWNTIVSLGASLAYFQRRLLLVSGNVFYLLNLK